MNSRERRRGENLEAARIIKRHRVDQLVRQHPAFYKRIRSRAFQRWYADVVGKPWDAEALEHDFDATRDAIAYARAIQRNRERRAIDLEAQDYRSQDALALRGTARRRFMLRRASPPWRDLVAIRAIYREAERRREDGEDVEVDHIIPIQGVVVCGLHVDSNLRILSMSANRAKGNRYS